MGGLAAVSSRKTPYASIPLRNGLGDEDSGSSLIKTGKKDQNWACLWRWLGEETQITHTHTARCRDLIIKFQISRYHNSQPMGEVAIP
jgi:hypothetical protein